MRTMIGATLLATAMLVAPVAKAQLGMAALRAEQARVPAATLIDSYGSDAQQIGELRLPKGKGPFPVAILVHGGCWTASMDTIKGISPLAEALRARGIATWSVEYRRIGNPGGGFPGTFEDIARGVDHLAALAKKHPLDLSRVVLAGHSAGAHLALWAASRPKLGAPYATSPIKPLSVVAIDGPAALAPFVGIDSQACGAPVIVTLMGGTPAEKPAEYRIASPADHLPLGVPQLIVLGDFKPLIAPYADAARKSGDTVHVLTPEGANHFDIITPGTANGASVVDFIATKAFAPRP